MKSNPYFFIKSPVAIFRLPLVFVLLSISLKAQTKENPYLLSKQINSSQNDKEKIKLYLRLGEYYVTKALEEKKDLDSAAISNKQAQKLSLKLNDKLSLGKVMLLDAKIDKDRGKWDLAISKMKKSLNYFLAQNMQEQAGDAYNELSYMYTNDSGSFETKVGLKKKAIECFGKSGVLVKKAAVLKDLAELYSVIDNPDEAIKLLKQSLSAYQSAKYKDIHTVYKLLSLAEAQKSNYNEALKYAHLAEKTAEKAGDYSTELASIYNQIGLVYYYLKKNQLALDYWEKGLVVAKKNKDKPSVRLIASNISTMLIRQKKFDEGIAIIKEYKKLYPLDDKVFEMRENYILFHTYTTLRQLKNADKYYKKLIEYYGEYGEYGGGQTTVLLSFAMYRLYKEDYKAFYKSVKLLDSINAKTGNDMVRAQNFMLWFKADSTQGKYLDAIKHYQLYKKHSDSAFNGEKSRQINSLQIQFDTEKKDKDIQLLTQKGKLQEARISTDSILRYVFIGSIIVLILFAALLYNRSRLKNRANKTLELKRQQIDEQNEQLKKLLGEKEWLLKEIHHRVKNNLQIVISLLNTQSAYLDNEDALMAIQNSQHRMHAMSLIHQKLYQSDNLATIDMSWYIYELINYIKECYSSEKNISFVMDVDKIFLDVAQAVPLGLILNEAVNNTIKYAFPDSRRGEVQVSFKKSENGEYKLMISDNGIGLPDDFNIDETESLGMNLMRGLTDQLEGNFTLESRNGLKITVNFRKTTDVDDQNINIVRQ
ncbi:histidine kinase dimerization/phosphoacceptor domain -containing protein [Chryseobacterium sp. MHB01]|uniref:tetratricopeptide repeat-containing sensor histidine kinase n=1 Tax=Chryseobacterium sp. MHB01 TaxID=3109433 RepID=UPI002AFE3381|nr:histidine kinase dimerization/phosphoacceptor domain -containing protein [Chryseobacterium sp. MHB01]MEA1848660.1 histidine kinase dimerization/phosphoacceptor domain -containing protein [Chryseobacterium sp. MHB01]